MSHRLRWLLSLSLTLIALAALGAPTPAAAQSLDPRTFLKPHVMVLVDTSGSMMWLPDRDNTFPHNDGYESRDRSWDGHKMYYCERTGWRQTGNASDDRSRMMVAQEVFTGRFYEDSVDSMCGYTEYGSWSIQPLDKGAATDVDFGDRRFIDQHEDGLLDLYREQVKFGLMTFDNSNATSTGSSGRHSWGPNFSLSQSDFPTWEWSWLSSYGLPNRPSVDLGVRGPGAPAGRLVSPGAEDDIVSIARVNAEIQAQLRLASADGGTPNGAAIHDAYHYFEHHCNERSPDEGCRYRNERSSDGTPRFDWDSGSYRGEDPYGACRPRALILVGDGVGTYDHCYDVDRRSNDAQNGWSCYYDGYPFNDYKTAAHVAEDLYADLGIRTYVIGYGPSAEARQNLSRIALKGGSCDEPGDTEGCFFAAENFDDMYAAMSQILSDMLGAQTSRTKAATTTRTSFRDTRSGYYEVAASFQTETGTPFWRGRLERVTFTCNADGEYVPAGEAEDFAEPLLSRDYTARRILTSDLTTATGDEMPRLHEAIGDDGDPLFEVCDASTSDVAIQRVSGGAYDRYVIPASAEYTIYPGSCSSDAECPDLGSERFGCLHGKCEALSNACTDTADCCAGASGLCESMCYAGACRQIFDDCTVHSACGEGKVCHLGVCRRGWASGCPDEVVRRQPLGDIAHSSPVIVGGPELDLASTGYRAFREAHGDRDTMVYVGANDGMLHAFLLGDIHRDADVDEGTELWAYVPRAVHSRLSHLQHGREPFVDATPVVKDARVARDASGDERWMTALVGGLRDGGRSYYALDVTDPHAPRFLWEHTGDDEGFALLGKTYGEAAIGAVALRAGEQLVERAVAILPGGVPADPADPAQGRALYVVDVATGELLRAFTALEDEDEEMAPITGSVSAHNDFAGALITRAFVGDQRGRLLRLDMTAPHPDAWTLDVFHDPADDLSSDEAPEPVFHRPALATNPRGELVIIYGNGDANDLASADTDRHFVASLTEAIEVVDGAITTTPRLNWFTDFDADGEKMTGEPIVFNSVAYFATFVPDDAPCDFGRARIHAVHYEEGSGLSPRAVHSLDGDDAPDRFLELGAGTVVMGAEVALRPTCVPEVDPDASPSTAGFGAYGGAAPQTPQLVLQTGARPFDAGAPAPVTTSTPPVDQVTDVLRVDLPPINQRLIPLSWGVVYD